MSVQMPLEELLTRLTLGDEAAARQFVAEYEPYIRRAIRPRLARANLRAAADSADVCQSELGTFLIHMAAGDFEIHSREDLEKLLYSIARKKFAMLVRREYAERRDRGRVRSLLSGDDQPGYVGDEPGAIAGARELLGQVRRRLAEDEARLFALRQQGRTWDEIALAVGGSAVLLRKRLSRALTRVAVELGLEDAND